MHIYICINTYIHTYMHTYLDMNIYESLGFRDLGLETSNGASGNCALEDVRPDLGVLVAWYHYGAIAGSVEEVFWALNTQYIPCHVLIP